MNAAKGGFAPIQRIRKMVRACKKDNHKINEYLCARPGVNELRTCDFGLREGCNIDVTTWGKAETWMLQPRGGGL